MLGRYHILLHYAGDSIQVRDKHDNFVMFVQAQEQACKIPQLDFPKPSGKELEIQRLQVERSEVCYY